MVAAFHSFVGMARRVDWLAQIEAAYFAARPGIAATQGSLLRCLALLLALGPRWQKQSAAPDVP